jgi:hypothetical protein
MASDVLVNYFLKKYRDDCGVYPFEYDDARKILLYVGCDQRGFLLVPIGPESLIILDRHRSCVYFLDTNQTFITRKENFSFAVFQQEMQLIEAETSKFHQYVDRYMKPNLPDKKLHVFDMRATILQIEWFLRGSWMSKSHPAGSDFPLEKNGVHLLMYLTEAIIVWHRDLRKSGEDVAESVVTTCIHHFLRRFVCNPYIPTNPDESKVEYIRFINNVDQKKTHRDVEKLERLLFHDKQYYDIDMDQTLPAGKDDLLSFFKKFVKEYGDNDDFEKECRTASKAWDQFMLFSAGISIKHRVDEKELKALIDDGLARVSHVECVICTIDREPREMMMFAGCGHLFCESCFAKMNKDMSGSYASRNCYFCQMPSKMKNIKVDVLDDDELKALEDRWQKAWTKARTFDGTKLSPDYTECLKIAKEIMELGRGLNNNELVYRGYRKTIRCNFGPPIFGQRIPGDPDLSQMVDQFIRDNHWTHTEEAVKELAVAMKELAVVTKDLAVAALPFYLAYTMYTYVA